MPRWFFKTRQPDRAAEPDPAPRDEVATAPTAEETTLLPAQILVDNFRAVTKALTDEGIQSWLVSDETAIRSIVGVMAADRTALLRAFARLAELGYWVRLPNKVRPEAELATFDLSELLTLSPVYVLFKRYALPGSSMLIRGDYSCEVELWEERRADGIEYVAAPRENRAAKTLSADAFTLVPTTWHGVDAVTPQALRNRMLDDIVFPIDVVYTWVDDSDPEWRARRSEAEPDGQAFHPGATDEARFVNRDELRYSLRSIASYAPWVRKIYLVTDRQVPAWLDLSNPRVQVVDHTDIFTNPGHLPTFNSNAIISSLHHIEGLSEHYIFMNDDVFLGRWVPPSAFFTPFGQAKVSPARNRRSFGSARLAEEPHINLTHNMRDILQDRFGVTISRAVKHTPHPQIRSVVEEMESNFYAHFERTWSHRFRHHEDIVADQFFHYYAQIIGRAVAIPIRYEYVDLKLGTRAQLMGLLKRRDRDVFCLNDTPHIGTDPISDQEVTDFLRAYFPLPSPFELSDPGALPVSPFSNEDGTGK